MAIAAEYRRAMVRRGYADDTIRHRIALVRELLDLCPALDCGADDIERLLDGHAYGPKSRYGALSHLHRFYVWARRNGYAAADPTELIDRPRLPEYKPRPAREADVRLALTVTAGRAHAVIALAAFGGLRAGEIASVRWADYDRDACRLRVLGKGRRERIVHVNRDLAAALAGCPQDGQAAIIGGQSWQVSRLVLRTFAGLGVHVTCHQLRHRAATAAYAATRELAAVKAFLGHRSIATTEVYAALDDDAARRAAEGTALGLDHSRLFD